jgi:phenylalanyl-tRNA synthetase beta chain
MPVVDIDPDELRTLTGHDEKANDQLKQDLFGLGLEFEGETEEGLLQFEFAPDRLDRLSVEGVARSLRYQYGEDRGVYVPDTNDAEWTIRVDSSVPTERPYVTGAVVRGVDLDEAALDSLIQLQEKLHATMGRQRAKGAIGIHDLAMLKGERIEETELAGDTSDPTDDLTPVGGEAGDGAHRAGVPGEDGAHRAGGPGGDGAYRADAPGEDGAHRADAPGGDEATDVGGPTITYRGIEPEGDTFVPLDADEAMTPADVLETHPTGETYADIVSAYERYPAIYDELGLFSFPPVINGRRTEVSTESQELFVEMTGTDQWTVDRMLAIVCYALDARGASIEEVDVVYEPDASGERDGDHLVRPELDTRRKTVRHDRIERTLGIDLEMDDVQELFARSGLDSSVNLGDESSEARSASKSDAAKSRSMDYEVEIPPYRVDVLHPADLVDDVGRAYGFGDLEPKYPDIGTIGGRHERSRLERTTRTALVGLGFEDLLNFHLSSPAENYERMNVAEGSDVLGGEPAVNVTSAYSEDYTQLRTWALPSLLHVLENNTHRRYPQELSEVGFVAHRDEAENSHVAEHRTVAAVTARTDATYEDSKGTLQALVSEFDVELATPATEHPSFFDGRAAAVEIDGEEVGVIGEIHPELLVERDLEVPVAAFEFRLDALAD